MPESVQTSMMDCGPSALKAILEGIDVSVHLGRLREACQTDVDGTSIDTLEDVLVQIGVDAEQILIPADHLLAKRNDPLPALLVVRLPDGNTHFIVVWRRLGRYFQIMDPAIGRRWMTTEELLSDCYRLEISVNADEWRAWAGSEEFLSPLAERLSALGLANSSVQQHISAAIENPGWSGLASLDAATRLTSTFARSGSIKGNESANTLTQLIDLACRAGTDSIPNEFWFVRRDPCVSNQLIMRGAVLIRVRGFADNAVIDNRSERLSEDLNAALSEAPSRPMADLLSLLRKDRLFAPFMVMTGIAVSAAAVIVESLLFRALLTESAQMDGASQQRILVGGTVAFLALLFFFQIPLISFALRIGRKLESRMRIALLEKIPQLGDRYFSSRLVSDLAERSHALYRLRDISTIGCDLLGAGFRLIFVVAGLCWLDLKAAPLILLLAAVVLGIPMLTMPVLTERDLRLRTHLGCLSRYYLDSFLGLFAIRAHGAENNVRTGHQSRLNGWASASRSFLKATIAAEATTSALVVALTVWLVFSHYQRSGESATTLLLIYWTLQLPAIGQQFATLVFQLPAHRNIVARLIEPLSTAEESRTDRVSAARPSASAVKIDIRNASVLAGGHTILKGINLSILPGEHIAVVGASGAGKSSLVGILLGWHKLATGTVHLDDELLDAEAQQRLRENTAWLDPAVQLWNKSLLENLTYGALPAAHLALHKVLDISDLAYVVDRLPNGFQTMLGEGGALLSGGEGQRVRFARALSRSDARLVIFDEPFRGLPSSERHGLLKQARTYWRSATFICVTHDLGQLQDFDRVLNLRNGAIIEDGSPTELLRGGSALKAMLDAEHADQSDWRSDDWRKLTITDGVVVESPQLCN